MPFLSTRSYGVRLEKFHCIIKQHTGPNFRQSGSSALQRQFTSNPSEPVFVHCITSGVYIWHASPPTQLICSIGLFLRPAVSFPRYKVIVFTFSRRTLSQAASMQLRYNNDIKIIFIFDLSYSKSKPAIHQSIINVIDQSNAWTSSLKNSLANQISRSRVT